MTTPLKILLIAIALGLLSSLCDAQIKITKADSLRIDSARWGLTTASSLTSAGTNYFTINEKSDTIPVLAYCCVNFNKPKFKWIKMYGIRQYFGYITNFNGLMIYESYLMSDRKTKSIYHVIYSIQK